MSAISDVELRLEALKIASSTSFVVWQASGSGSLVEYAEKIYQWLNNGRNVPARNDVEGWVRLILKSDWYKREICKDE